LTVYFSYIFQPSDVHLNTHQSFGIKLHFFLWRRSPSR